jgi:hypothetical protein
MTPAEQRTHDQLERIKMLEAEEADAARTVDTTGEAR